MRNNPDDLSNQLLAKIKKWLKHEVTRCLDTVYYYLLDSSAFRDKFREKK